MVDHAAADRGIVPGRRNADHPLVVLAFCQGAQFSTGTTWIGYYFAGRVAGSRRWTLLPRWRPNNILSTRARPDGFDKGLTAE